MGEEGVGGSCGGLAAAEVHAGYCAWDGRRTQRTVRALAVCCLLRHDKLRHVSPPEGTRGRGTVMPERVCARRVGSRLRVEGWG